MRAGIQLHRLESGSVRWSQFFFSDYSIGKEAYRTGKDMEHFAEGKISKTCQTG